MPKLYICNVPFCKNKRSGRKGYCGAHLYEREKRGIKQFQEVLPLWAVKRCNVHGLLRLNQVTKTKPRANGKITYICRACRRLQNSYLARQPLTKKKRREVILKKRYKITQKQYEVLLSRQGNVCAICSRAHEITKHGKKKSFQIDHCHQKESEGVIVIRGLLCSRCNMGLGSFLDNTKLLKKAIKYLEDGVNRL